MVGIGVYRNAAVAGVGEAYLGCGARGDGDFQCLGYSGSERNGCVESQCCPTYSSVGGECGGGALKTVILEELAVDAAVALCALVNGREICED